jgi:hypothetical protein
MSDEKIFPLKEADQEKRCKCGHRFSNLLIIKAGLSLGPGAIYALGCPDCGGVKIVASSTANEEEALKAARALMEKVARVEKETAPHGREG